MPGMTPAEVAQLYNGIYEPAKPMGTAPLPTLTLEEMYRGIYGPANAAPAPQPPSPPTPPSPPQAPDVYQGIYGPANLSSQPGSFPTFGALADLFPNTTRTRTQQADPAPVVASGYGAGNQKADNERLLPNSMGSLFGVGQPPSTRSVRSVPMGQPDAVVASYSTPGMPRPRPDNAVTTLASMYAPSAAPSQRQPLKIAVNGANPISSYAPTPAPASQRPAAPPAVTPVQSFRDQGYSPSQAYDAANDAARERAIAGARDPEAARRLNARG